MGLVNSYEQTTCSFIVKIWAEVEEEPQLKTWRGRVTHVPSGAQHLFVELEHLKEIIAAYLKEMGVPTHSHLAALPTDMAERREMDEQD